MKAKLALLFLLLTCLLAACKGEASSVTPTETPPLVIHTEAPPATAPPELYSIPGLCSLQYRPDVFQCTETADGVSFTSLTNPKVYVSIVGYPELSPEDTVNGILLQKDLPADSVLDGGLGDPPVQTKTLQYDTENSAVFVHVIPCGSGSILMELGGIGEETPEELSAKGLMLDSFALDTTPVG